MKRVAIIGGGIAGLAAAYELELARKRGVPLDWHLYEATDRLGGIVETTRLQTPEGEWILEGGPDAWVTEKPWARELAIELGLESELIPSNDATRKTYIYLDGQLQAMPDRMRMMVPEDLGTLDSSPLFSAAAKQAYAQELAHAAELRASSPFVDPQHDESVAKFVHRHFGDEVLDKIAAPLLSGVFGGDVHKLSARAVMAPFVKLEQEHGSLIAALQSRAAAWSGKPAEATFTSLRNGMGSLGDALVKTLPPERLVTSREAYEVQWEDEAEWYVHSRNRHPHSGSRDHLEPFDHVILATSLDATRKLLRWLDPVRTNLLPSSGSFESLTPSNASSAVLASFGWDAPSTRDFDLPPGFGFLVPPPDRSSAQTHPLLLACTFVDQKFAQRVPDGCRLLRTFFGGESALTLNKASDEDAAAMALAQLRSIFGKLPAPSFSSVRRWPRSLPQYEVGHMERMARLDELVAKAEGLHLLGNSYRGVGIPDLIRDGRVTARSIVVAS